ncbi:zinc finger CW-type PWWP domain protein 2 isoform X1 [Meriones unguiculatus]|uniref:zinc finger CW-type PWWP domain protein 2 isoform X1 n=1 Tax=Meriones unguiculatus TaxID=10047 RepID=UPI00293E21EB|nr:zinc finger CW-type PWWP domain protein 2 isoform X1 [Meriones unguiculatus]XP_060241069.1 zinc finger CW-type PWWP domain protein 2 isoform X1 [Meriones unguiculatus]
MDAALEISEFVNRVWVQCENESCLKWRLLSPKAASRVDHSKPWYCFMNADSSYNSCSVSEEDFPEESQFLERGYKIVYSQLPLGSLVLVKLQNWPSWPGILCPDPFKGKYVTYDQDGNVENYYIEYLGEPHATAWMSAAFVGHFSLTLQMAEYTNKNRRRWYRSALEEAYRLYWCSPEQRLEACCLSKQDTSKADTKAAVVAKKRMQAFKNNTEKKKPMVRKRKRTAVSKCSVEDICSEEALSQENVVVSETEGLLKELEKMLQDVQEPQQEPRRRGEQLSQCSLGASTGSPFQSYHEEDCILPDGTVLKAGECIENITNNLKKIAALISEI